MGRLRLTIIRAAAVAVVACAVAMGGAACESRTLGGTKVDGGPTKPISPPACANVGCAAPVMCGQACPSPCGCCLCSPGTINGDSMCVGGCYVPIRTVDGSADAVASDARPGDDHVDGWLQPLLCDLPFEAGSCDALFPVFAYVNGACVPRTYGGCGGNANRFSTLEECLATCDGSPIARPCPSGRVAQSICVACGPAGGCAKTITACALPCDAGTSCPQSLPVCDQGVCQWAGCI